MAGTRGPNGERLSYYPYEPNFAANVIFGILYSIVGLVAIFQYFYYKSWFWWPVTFSCLMELVGYVDRIPSIKNPLDRDMFIIQFVMIILAPAVVAAGFYMAYARIIFWITPEKYRSFRHMWVPARWVTPIFVSFDIIAFGIQLVGATVIAAAEPWEADKLNRGHSIVRVGLAFQLACFGFFTFVAARFVFIARRFQETWPKNCNWLRLLYALNLACLLILLRSIFRMVEFSMGSYAYPTTNEWMFFVFDSLLVLVALAVFTVIHPGMYLPNLGIRKRRVYTGRKPIAEVDTCQLKEKPATDAEGAQVPKSNASAEE